MKSRGRSAEIGKTDVVLAAVADGDASAHRDGASPNDAADAFLDAFDTFVQAVRRARGAQTGERTRALTLSQYGLLQPLGRSEGARIRDLAEQAGIAPSTATRILDALERRGIVQRRPSAGDRRGVKVTLTDAGRDVLRDEDDWLRAREREFYGRLPDEERRLAPDLLRRLAALIDEMAAGPAGDGQPGGHPSSGRHRRRA